ERGPHLAGLFNVSTGESNSLQAAGLLNFAADEMRGAQLSGLVNFAGKHADGAQVSGLFNVAPSTMKGVQISALINYATRLHGMQLGLVNVSDSIKGVPIGFFSFVMKGYHQIEISADEIFYTNVAFRTGVRQFYNIFTVGVKPSTFKDDETYWTFGYGVGTAPRLNRWLSLNVDVTANQVGVGQNLDALNLLNKLYAGVEFHPAKKIGLVIGATLNAYVTDNSKAPYPELFTDYNPNIISEKNYSNDINVKMWLGGKVGLRFL
ncbi:MAG TPA: hypothetical protein VK666_30490, partial [Chryseolinea sp.]|nr:hypothetical protein [Chryseolinea sp.]